MAQRAVATGVGSQRDSHLSYFQHPLRYHRADSRYGGAKGPHYGYQAPGLRQVSHGLAGHSSAVEAADYRGHPAFGAYFAGLRIGA